MRNPFSRMISKFPYRFRVERKDSRTARYNVSGGGGVIWSDKNYLTFAKESYLRNVISFRCISMISQAMSSIPWGLFERAGNGKRNKVESHPVNVLLRRPNPLESFNQILLKSVAFYCIAGNSYMEKVGPDTGPNQGTPKELYVLRPDRVQVLQDGTRGLVSGYRYTGISGGYIDFPRDLISGSCDLLHFKAFNPLDDFYGGSTSESTGYEIDTYNEMTNWNKKLLQNMARPGMIFQVYGNLTTEQWDRLEKQLAAEKSGSDNAGKNLILEGEKGNTAIPYGWSPKDLDYVEGGREMARRICLGYGTPPMLLGIPGDNTYSNYQEARLAFTEETVFFYLMLYLGEMNNWLFGPQEEKLFLDALLDEVPALAPRRDTLWKRANESNFIKINEKREMVGKDDIGPDGDVILVSSLVMPLGQEANVDETGPGTEPNPKIPPEKPKPGNGRGEENVTTD